MRDMRLQGICTISLNFLSTLQWQIQGRGPLFVDQTEAQRAQKNFLGDQAPPYLMVWMTAPPPPPPTLFEGLDGNSILDILCSLLI